jgi:hypothetical protein
MAFTQNSAPTLLRQPQNGKVQIANADAQAQKVVVTAGASGSKVNALMAVSTDTVARDLQISITNGGVSYPLGAVTVPIGAGNSGAVPPVNLLDPTKLVGLAIDSDGTPYILLVFGDTLTVSALTSVTAAKLITVTAPAAGDF